MSEPDTDTYALRTEAVPEIAAPELFYRPPAPRGYAPKIGLIGAGGISVCHLDAYRTAGWDVAAICSRTRAKAEAKAAEYFPDAAVSDDWQEVLDDPSIDVVDVTPHPDDRVPIVEAALMSGKHVLSQKPFVLDLATGRRLADLADAQGVRLAVNQNGRWAPHHAWMRAAVRAGLLGEVRDVSISIHWDHGWIAGTPFERDPNVILFDFGVHWFDFLASLVGDRVEAVYASVSTAEGAGPTVPLLAQALVRMAGGQASLTFAGATPFGPCDRTFIAGSAGSLESTGPDLGDQQVTLTNAEGRARPVLQGSWFNDGFRGAMGELLSAIEEGREPENGARANLRSLELAFAAVASASERREVGVGEVSALGPET